MPAFPSLLKPLTDFCGVALLTALLLTASPSGARTTGPARTQPVDMVVIHSTGGPTCDAHGQPIWVPAGEMEDNLRTIGAHPQLGIHWMIDRDGTVRSSVPESRVAHHVLSYSRRSIAIELINDGDGKDPFPPAQIDALVALLQGIVQRNPQVARAGVVRHSDVDHGTMPCAPQRRRKVDPGDAYPHTDVLRRVFGAPAADVPEAASPRSAVKCCTVQLGRVSTAPRRAWFRAHPITT